MAAIRRRDTKPERVVRSLLHARGLRFRVDYPIRVEGGRPIRPDVVFPGRRIAVFIDGCFWHGCPEHGHRPTVQNAEYWGPKIAGNAERDGRHSRTLETAGWRVLRFWEHEEPERIVSAIAALVHPASRSRGFSATRRGR